MALIKRTIEKSLKELSKSYPVVTLTGPRQSGKTTICKKVFKKKPCVNLETPDIRQFAIDDPRGFLAKYPDGAILDEIQRAPDLVSYLQVLVDEDGRDGLFILTGSQQFEVTNTINQSLAGRTALLRLLPFSIQEINANYTSMDIDGLMYHGFYPRLWEKKLNPTQALGDYFETYVQRDLRQLVSIKNLHLFQRFIRLCAGRTGQLLNLSSLANDTGVSHSTAHSWISLLEASYIVFLLQPFYSNISKRLVKSPKMYFYDTGLASYLLGIENEKQITRDPLRGNLFENMVIIEAVKFYYNQGRRGDLYFYRDSKGNEVDLLLKSGTDLFPIEIKSGMTLTKDYFKGLNTFFKVFHDNTLSGGGLVYGGDISQQRTGVTVVTFSKLHEFLNKTEKLF